MSLDRYNYLLIIATLVWLISLACGPLDRLREFNAQQPQPLKTPVHAEDVRPTQALTLTVTPPPTPTLDPAALVAATAAAEQAWPVSLDYGEERVNFELAAPRAQQTPNSSPRRAEVKLLLRQLPPRLFQEAGAEPFLAQLRQKLTLSIPERNLLVTCAGFRLEQSDPGQRALIVIYFFNADLADFKLVELIVAGPGNPLVAPVPVQMANGK